MSVIDAVRELFSGPGTDASESRGAYWCDDCGERILDLDTEEEPPSCPTCGEEMRFERSPDSGGCAC
jgi:DNA-directed RNA polymerase subunit RPC12/RpoP